MSDNNEPPISKIARLSDVERRTFYASLGTNGLDILPYMWELWARPNQLLPPGDNWDTFCAIAGRGFGKTRMGSEAVRKWAYENPGCRIALIGQTAADARDVIVEGDSGILATSPPWFMPEYQPSKRRVVWPNGSMASTFSADQPDQLRGPQFHFAWLDEFAKYEDCEATWSQLQFGLRLGRHPRALITTTPRPIPALIRILKNERTITVKGSTYDNKANLASNFLAAIDATYGKTRLGRQEIYGDVLEDNEHALWKRSLFKYTPETPDLVHVVVAVDPSGGVDETGIVVFGTCEAGHGYLLADYTVGGSPQKWGQAVVFAYDEYEADAVVVERNFGGDMAKNTITQEGENLYREGKRKSQFVGIREVTASRGKVVRAEPVALMYEQGRVFHVGNFNDLEDELCSFHMQWNRAKDGSPNRLDALVWAVHATLINDAPPELRIAMV